MQFILFSDPMKTIKKIDPNFFLKIHEYLCKVFFWIGGCLIFSIAFITSYEVGMRYFFNKPTSWAIDFAEYFLLYGTFFGAAWILKLDGHVKVTVLQELLGRKAKLVLEIINSFIGTVSCAVLSWQGFHDTWETFAQGILRIRPVTIPKWTIMWVIPFGLLLFSSYFLKNFISLVLQLKNNPAAEKERL